MPIEKDEVKQNAFSQLMKPDALPPRQEVKPPEHLYRVSAPSRQDGHEVTFIVRSSMARDDLRKLVESGVQPKSEEGFKCQIIDPKTGKIYDVGLASVVAFVDGRTARVDEAPKELPKRRMTEEQKFTEARRWTSEKKIDVAALQRTLVEIGHLKPGYKEGEFDRATYAAVVALQSKSNNEMNADLVVDGKYGPKTLAAVQTLQSNLSVATIHAEESLVCDAGHPDLSAPTTEAQKPTKPIAQTGVRESGAHSSHTGDETVVGRRAPTYVSQSGHQISGERTVRGDVPNPGRKVDRIADVGRQVNDGLTSYGDQSDVGTIVDPSKRKPKTPPG